MVRIGLPLVIKDAEGAIGSGHGLPKTHVGKAVNGETRVMCMFMPLSIPRHDEVVTRIAPFLFWKQNWVAHWSLMK